MNHAVIHGVVHSQKTTPVSALLFESYRKKLATSQRGVQFRMERFPPTMGVTDPGSVQVRGDKGAEILSCDILVTDSFAKFLASGIARMSGVQFCEYAKAAAFLELPEEAQPAEEPAVVALATLKDMATFIAGAQDVPFGNT